MKSLAQIREDLLYKLIEAEEITEYGLYTDKLSVKLAEKAAYAEKHNKEMRIVGGLNNFDFSHRLFELLKDDVKAIVAGMKALCDMADTKALIYIPEGREDMAGLFEAEADKAGLEYDIVFGIVNMRRSAYDLICHFETLRKIGEAGTKDINTVPVAVDLISADGQKNSFEMKRVPYGTKLSEIAGVEAAAVKWIKAAGRLYDAAYLDTVIEKETVLGDGVIRIYDNSCCIVDKVYENIMQARSESCGKCTFCREGLCQFAMRYEDIINKKGDMKALPIMENIADTMSFSNMCSVGAFAGFEISDSVKLFADEYESHIKKKKCPTGVCRIYTSVYIDPNKCTGCTSCLSACPENCIEGIEGYIHMVEDSFCTRCEKCIDSCDEKAIVKTADILPKIPDRLTRVGRFKRY